jgi:Ni/Fe-hydrogenase subunit HybB-like protein
MSPTLEFLIIVFTFVARIAVPFFLVFGVLYLLKNRLEPHSDKKLMNAVNRKTFLIAVISFLAIGVIGTIGYALVMNEFINLLMLVRDAAVLAYMFFLRIVAPIIVLYFSGAWLKRKLDPESVRDQKPLAEQFPILKKIKLPHLSGRGSIAGLFLTALWIAALGITVVRFFFGLGATTNLSDEFPWGLWIGFDVVSGVALAAGGFVMAGTVHVFNLKRYHSIVRPAILTALLGYLLVIVGLLFDLGRWYNIWHPMFFWNIHSPMLEVAWCVMLYSTVLIVEFSPAILERFRMERLLKIVSAMTLPVVILGMVLSTLHQSSLGSLFLIAPEKINPLWYSSLLPVFFFLSAVAVGLGMTIVESNLSARAMGKELENDLLKGLGRALAFVLAIYLVLKFVDLIARDAFGYAFTPGFHATIFWIEVLAGFITPMLLMAFNCTRSKPGMVFLSGGLVVGGVIFNRLNTSLLGWWAYANSGPIYIPSLSEITITLSLVAAGVVAFGLAAKFLPVFPKEHLAHA